MVTRRYSNAGECGFESHPLAYHKECMTTPKELSMNQSEQTATKIDNDLRWNGRTWVEHTQQVAINRHALDAPRGILVAVAITVIIGVSVIGWYVCCD